MPPTPTLPIGKSTYILRLAKDVTLTTTYSPASGGSTYTDTLTRGTYVMRHDTTAHVSQATRFASVKKAGAFVAEWETMNDAVRVWTDTRTGAVLNADEVIEIGVVVLRSYLPSGPAKD
jgi:hypothetical protein